MKNKRLTKQGYSQKAKEGRSPFVVDLRTFVADNSQVSQVKKEKIKLSKRIELFLKNSRQSSDKKIRPNLMRPNLFSSKIFKISGLGFSVLAILIFVSRIFRKKNNFWLKNYRSSLDNFQKILDKNLISLKKNKHQSFSARNLFKKEKIDAETKLSWYRSIFSFALILILLIIPFKLFSYFNLLNFDSLEERISNYSKDAFNNLLAAGSALEDLNLQKADQALEKAADNFLSAQNDLSLISDSVLYLASLADNPKLKLAAESKNFLRVGELATSFGRQLVLATDSLLDSENKDFANRLQKFIEYGNLASNEAKKLNAEFNKINSNNLPAEYRQQFKQIAKQSEVIAKSLESFLSSAVHLEKILGVSQDRRYLLIFQNNSELRATGGFLGSYAILDIREGAIRNLEIPGGGSYDTEGAMSVRLVAPKPLWLVNPLWHFWDANWWPDWPTSARHLMWFYEKSGGSTVDGVISLTPDVIEDLLLITGPITLEEYGLTVNSDNFWESVQTVVEYKNIPEDYQVTLNLEKALAPIESTLPLKQGLETNTGNKPKKIIGDLTVKLLEVLPDKLNKDNLLKIVGLFEENIAAKNILFYFNDEELQKEATRLNFSGEVKDAPFDYFLVVNTNIAGQKSDRKIEEEIKHESAVGLDGSIINTLTITKTHTGLKNEIFTGVRNVNWLRVYVPLGSELISASGFNSPDPEYLKERPEPYWQEHELLQGENKAIFDSESQTSIYEESGKTVFANWLMVDPGESRTIVLKYKLPFNFYNEKESLNLWDKLNNAFNPESGKLQAYSLLAQKQPGAKASNFSSHLIFEDDYQPLWSYPENIITLKGWDISDSLTADKYWSVLVEKNN